MKPLRVLSYNIHKGFTPGNFGFVLHEIRDAIRSVNADLVFLQEVVGQHVRHAEKIKRWPRESQFEHLAEDLWPHFKYGQNAVYEEGHHGNAILSRYPIVSSDNIELSRSRWECRGLLHAVIEVDEMRPRLHAFCSHFGLFEADRRKQADLIIRRIREHAKDSEPLILAGDFNDWQETLTHRFETHAGLREAFKVREGQHARTFPAWLPILKLDRIYFRGLETLDAARHYGGTWSTLSDHAAISAVFK